MSDHHNTQATLGVKLLNPCELNNSIMQINITGRTESYRILTQKYEIGLLHLKYFNPGISEYEIVTIKDKNGKKVVVDDEERAELEERILEQIAKLEDEGRFR